MAFLDGLELATGIIAIAMAVIVLFAAPRQRVAQALALVLFVDGAGWFGIADGLGGYASGPWQDIARFSLAASPWLYGWLVVETLDVPATRWACRLTPWPWIIMALAIPLLLVAVLDASPLYAFISQFVGIISGPHIIIATWALVAALQHSRQRQDRQATAYLAAFALRDIAVVALFSAALVAKSNAWAANNFEITLLVVKVALLGHLVSVIYGVMSGLVLGLDDQVRTTIQKALVLVAVSAVFLVVTEGAEILIGVDSPLLAILAAGVITMVFQPVQLLAQRLSARLFPGSSSGHDMDHQERLDLYGRQFAIAVMDGRIQSKEREMLDRLREALGLSPDEAGHIEARLAPPQAATDPGQKPDAGRVAE